MASIVNECSNCQALFVALDDTDFCFACTYGLQLGSAAAEGHMEEEVQTPPARPATQTMDEEEPPINALEEDEINSLGGMEEDLGEFDDDSLGGMEEELDEYELEMQLEEQEMIYQETLRLAAAYEQWVAERDAPYLYV